MQNLYVILFKNDTLNSYLQINLLIVFVLNAVKTQWLHPNHSVALKTTEIHPLHDHLQDKLILKYNEYLFPSVNSLGNDWLIARQLPSWTNILRHKFEGRHRTVYLCIQTTCNCVRQTNLANKQRLCHLIYKSAYVKSPVFMKTKVGSFK
jgi:hypothetical protein